MRQETMLKIGRANSSQDSKGNPAVGTLAFMLSLYGSSVLRNRKQGEFKCQFK
jgi:hypothetical protein